MKRRVAKLKAHQIFLDSYKGILDPGIRWKRGREHRPESKDLMRELEVLDFEVGGDFFCFKTGGDGDHGDHLMYLLDMIFDLRAQDSAEFGGR